VHSYITRTSNASAGNDYTTTSTTPVDVDAANLTQRYEFTGHPIRISFRGVATGGQAGIFVHVAFKLNSTIIGPHYRIYIADTSGIGFNHEFEIVPGAAGSYTLGPVFYTSANTGALLARSTAPLQFSVVEMQGNSGANTGA